MKAIRSFLFRVFVRRYQILYKVSPLAILLLDTAARIHDANPAALQLFELSASEIRRNDFPSLLVPSDRSSFIRHFESGLLKPKGVDSEFKILSKSQEHRLISVESESFTFAGEQFHYVILRDITEQKYKEQFLLRSEKLTVAGQLAAEVAHEIYNPLTTIKGFLQLMGSSEDQISKYLPIIREELGHIELIISELLMLAKPQAAQMKLIDLAVLIEDIIKLTQIKASLHNIEFQQSYPEMRSFIYCEENQIKQVFINFLNHAIESMPQGGVIQVEVCVNDEHEAVVRIKDQGCGISEEKLDMIGVPFYSTKDTGTGLGMMVSFKIIEHHGGKIHISSEVGLGTTTEVILPVTDIGYRS